MTADPARLPLGNTSIRLHREETHAGDVEQLLLEFKGLAEHTMGIHQS